jgi:pimeloyl-ACP methyl ester carboxylesterase
MAATAAVLLAATTACTASVGSTPVPTSTPASAAASGSAAPVPVPQLAWGACAADSGAAQARDFQCAKAEVPLDHRDPGGRKITLSRVKRSATGPGERIGSLFLNPGGPGGTATTQVVGWIGLLPQGLQERFDVVSWDPRGVGESAGVQCFDNLAAEQDFLGEFASFPVGAEQERGYVDRWREFGERCAQRDGDLLAHTNTAATARDLDLLRQAVGDEKLSYLGLSYGTFLGATYANLFPDKVRGMVLDGNLAPSAWTNDGRPDADEGLSARIGSNAAVAATVKEFVRLCGSTDTAHCPFSEGSPQATQDKLDKLLDRLRQGPIGLDGRRLTYAEIVDAVNSAMDIVQPLQSPVDGASAQGWGLAAGVLQKVWEARDAAVPQPSPVPPITPYPGPEQGLAVVCGDSPNPPTDRYAALAAEQLSSNGPFAVDAVWGPDEQCSTWPVAAADAYRGPWDRGTAPVLVVGPTNDPSTPFENSRKMVAELGAGGRLLTVEGYGHTAFLNPSACAAAAQVAYLVEGTLPAEGTVCPQDKAPFADPVPTGS